MSEPENGRRTLVRAARAVDANGSTDDPWLLLDGRTIAATGSGRDAPSAAEVIDLADATVVPGFIDIHGHGGAQGAYDNDIEEMRRALAMHRMHGTTRSVLSLVTNPVETLSDSLGRIRALMDADPLVLGAHLEGPFLSPNNRGAHNPQFLVPPTSEAVDTLLAAPAGTIRQVTIAPEADGAIDAIGHFADAGVTVAVGHTVADMETTQKAFDAGATLLTHAFNAMPGIHHRAPGPIVAACADERVTLELILDAVHVHPLVAMMLFRAAPHRVALITDAMSATGSPDGDYSLGSLAVTVTDGIAHVAGTDTIAGSTLTQDTALRIAVERSGLALNDAVAALTIVPARAIGEEARLGLLRTGYAADLVALGPDLAVRDVWADGERLPSPLGAAA